MIRRIRRLSKNQKFEELASLSAKELESKTTISLEEIKYTLREVRDTAEEIIYHLQIMHGLRISEALGMTYENIDFKNNIVHVRQQSQAVSLTQIKGSKFENEYTSYNNIRSLKTDESMRTIPLH